MAPTGGGGGGGGAGAVTTIVKFAESENEMGFAIIFTE